RAEVRVLFQYPRVQVRIVVFPEISALKPWGEPEVSAPEMPLMRFQWRRPSILMRLQLPAHSLPHRPSRSTHQIERWRGTPCPHSAGTGKIWWPRRNRWEARRWPGDPDYPYDQPYPPEKAV